MLRPPFRPPVAGRFAFFFGPIAGAIVSVISLRHMGHPLKARRVLRWTLLAAVILAIVLILIPDALGRPVGLAAEIGFYLIFPRIQDREYDEWQAAHPTVEPSNGWRALGWALLGTLMFLVIAVTVGFLIVWIFPSAV
jgi:disulfide bond formation protein DsbB